MSDRPDITPEDGVKAAEYALGLLSGADLSAFEARLKDDANLRRDVAEWEFHFAEMAEEDVDPVAVPARVEAALMAELFEDPPVSFWRRFLGWRGISVAAAVILGLFLYMEPAPETGRNPQRGQQTGNAAG